MGHENLADLVCLCADCHAGEHAEKRIRGKKRDKNAPKRIRFR
jgi:predicted HNH restriction endonuclease